MFGSLPLASTIAYCNNSGTMPRFVLLRHTCPPHSEKLSHWDFMLEWEGALRTWELQELPSAWAALLGEAAENSAVPALPLPDHRLAYLDYEGPIRGDRGSVRCCDRGTYKLLQATQKALAVELRGVFLMGAFCLRRQGQGWTLAPKASSR